MFEGFSALFDASLMMSEDSSFWSVESHEMNPNRDRRIALLQQLRFIVLRNWALRDREFRAIYWRRFPTSYQMIIEAEWEAYESLAKDLYALEQVLTWELIEADELAEFHRYAKDPKFLKTIQADRFTKAEVRQVAGQVLAVNMAMPTDSDRLRLRLGLASILFPRDVTNSVAYEKMLMNPYEGNEEAIGDIGSPSSMLIPSTTSLESLREYWRWFTYTAGLQQELIASWQQAVFEEVPCKNELAGTRSDRTLRINEHIPLPTMVSFLGWYSCAGLQLRETTLAESSYWTKLAGFEPSHVITYVPPMMPLTKEHRAGGLVQDTESTADQSLGIKSKGHRWTFEKLDYGIWGVRTILLNVKTGERKGVVESAMTHKDTRASEIVYSHMQMLPYTHTNVAGFKLFKGVAPKFALQNPYIAQPQYLDVLWPKLPLGFDTGWRAKAKWEHKHYRFDSTVPGVIAYDKWCAAFEIAAIHWLKMPVNHRLAQYVESVAELGLAMATPHVTETVMVKGKAKTIDLTNLFNVIGK